ncbi:hypothetical protein N2152v2_006039 [Parachlorella kessleri]
MRVVLAIAIIALVAVKLDNVVVTTSGDNIHNLQVKVNSTCSLGTAIDSNSLCAYTYAACAISLVVSLAISIIQCCTCNLCGLGRILDLIFAVVGTGWWAIAAAVIQKHVDDAANEGLSLQHYRTATVGLMWTEVALFGLLVISGVVRVANLAGLGEDRYSKV